MKRILLLILIFFVSLSDLLFAQENPEFSAQIRPRLVLDNRDFNSNTGINSYTEMRTRLGVSFSPLSDINAFLQIQDSRVFGTEPSTLANTQNVDIHQAYFIIKDLFELPMDLKAGRMEPAYGTERLIGAVGWSNVGRSFDGVVLVFDFGSVDVDLFGFRVDESGLPADSLDQNLIGVHTDVNLFVEHNLQPFLYYHSSTNPAYPFNTFTFGVNLLGDINGFHHELEIIRQAGGEINDGPRSVNAFLFAYNASYTIDTDFKPMFGGGIDYLSGDGDLNDDKFKAFNTLFATNHKYYGYMDYFINLPGNTFGLGLIDLHTKAGIQPSDKFKATAIFHLFKSAEERVVSAGRRVNDFGSEIDLVLDYSYNDYVKFQYGAALFSPGEIFETRQGRDSSTWFYLMATVNL